MIKELLNAKIRERNISIRQASREIGIAHTTVTRILNGEPCDMDTLGKVANWLSVEPSSLLDAGSDDLASQIAVFLQSEPELANVLEDAMRRIVEKRIKPETLRDLLAYMAYRINLD